jgi:tetratricopeptide (TPR) repeat protein
MPKVKTSSKSEAELWDRLMAAWNADKPACHFELATQYTKTYPKKTWGWLALADVFSRTGRYAEAQQALRRAQRLATPEWLSDVYVEWGHFYDHKCAPRLAEKWYRRALAKRVTMHRFVFLGAALARQGRLAEAKQCHSRAIRLSTSSPDEAYYNLGLILSAQRKYKEALKCFERAVKLDPAYTIAEVAWKDVVEAQKLMPRNSRCAK